jgi:hypothetical protein
MNLNTNTTVLKVSTEEEPALQKICRLMDIHVRCYHLVNEDALLVAEVYTNDPGSAYTISRLVRAEMENIKSATPKLAL